MKAIVTSTKKEAQGVADKIFATKLKVISKGELLINKTLTEVSIKSLTDNQLATDFAIFGYRSGVKQMTKGLTTAWDIPKQRLDRKWIIEYSDIIPTTGLTLEEWSDDWFDNNI